MNAAACSDAAISTAAAMSCAAAFETGFSLAGFCLELLPVAPVYLLPFSQESLNDNNLKKIILTKRFLRKRLGTY